MAELLTRIDWDLTQVALARRRLVKQGGHLYVATVLLLLSATACSGDSSSSELEDRAAASVERGFTAYMEEGMTTDMSGGTTTCEEVAKDVERNIRGWRSKGSYGAEPTEATIAGWRCSWVHDGPIPPQHEWKYPYPPFSAIACEVGTSYDPTRDEPAMQPQGFNYVDHCEVDR